MWKPDLPNGQPRAPLEEFPGNDAREVGDSDGAYLEKGSPIRRDAGNTRPDRTISIILRPANPAAPPRPTDTPRPKTPANLRATGENPQ
ncbi:hypothetical protein MILUP08_43635 [Micromonospora lupini str. Lupac 08]|uniref:Uncharacterized protein n=1 Tax=Micromonospora lupini str. Lupac 08 TaxID=1150864 RepID=I0L4H7_9ACTN|nr:hypothetical protein MILUP08_43635 [Micromonospora lupini str. Lupac 08]